MRVRLLVFLIGLGFLLNGCLVDRIKERVYYLKMRDGTYVKVKRKVKIGKLHKKKVKVYKKSREESLELEKKPLYMPSKPELVDSVEEVEVIPLKKPISYEKKVVKRVKKSSSKVVKSKKKGSKIKKYKKVTKKKVVKKIKHEPYSIGSDESDPELLGPQTTLDENPLKKAADKKI